MNKKYVFVAFFLISILSSGLAQEGGLKYRGFSGGMMIHSGYLKSSTFTIHSPYLSVQNTVEGLSFGLGGCARIHFGNNLRVGGEGFISNVRYGDYNSHFKLSSGGLLVDYAVSFSRFTTFAGAVFGGGSVENITLNSKPLNDYTAEASTSYRTYSFIYITPMLGLEYALTKKLSLMMKMDYMFNVNNPQDDFAKGIRIFFGMMFYSLGE